MEHLRRVPKAGDSFTVDGFGFEVVDMDGRRVDKVLVTPPAGTDDEMGRGCAVATDTFDGP